MSVNLVKFDESECGVWHRVVADMVVPEWELAQRRVGEVHHMITFPGHWSGLRANDLETFASLVRCNAMRGHLPLHCKEWTHRPSGQVIPAQIIPPDHFKCGPVCA